MLNAANLTYNCRVIEGIEYSDSRRRAHDKNIILRLYNQKLNKIKN